MLLSLLFLAQAAPQDPPDIQPPAVAEQLVVMAQRLDTFKFRVRRRDGEFRCDIEQSSGDLELDEIRCNAFRYCMMRVDSDVQALAELDLPRSERGDRINTLTQSVAPCAENYEDAVLTRLAWERAQS